MKEVDKPVFIDNVEIAGSYLFLPNFTRFETSGFYT